MFFQISLYIALGIFGLGLIYKLTTWFRYSLSFGIDDINPYRRIFAALKGIIMTLLSPKILILLAVFFRDILLQYRIFRESRLRWIIHMCIFGGFLLLLLMHALEDFITIQLFPDSSSTLNPFLFLRNLFGFMVIMGLGLSVYRRRFMKIPRLITNAMDRYIIIILAVIMVSGFVLEGEKIVSYKSYQTMVDDYADSDDKESLEALESYWVKNFSVVSPNLKGPFNPEMLTQGKELHEMSCSACHSQPQWAFLSFGVAKTVTPVATILDKADAQSVIRYIHFLACFVGLAYLPFSRMFHIFASPLSLLMNAVMDSEKSDPANIATKQMIELDACTHCGTCSVQCNVGIAIEAIHNINILPSEKLISVRKIVSGKKLNSTDIGHLLEGLYLCVNCYQCTLVCPAGINLQDLWFNVREALLQKGSAELLVFSPLSFYRGLRQNKIAQGPYQKPLEQARKAIADKFNAHNEPGTPINLIKKDNLFAKNLRDSFQGNTFSYCYTCTTCTSACPVASNYDNPPQALDLVPHQIIHAAIVGLPDITFRSRMLWSCLGCYQCQEACPQGVKITDVFYELKNMAISRQNGSP